ncbi:unnamed protein product [Rotaria magnacalcarata]|uniref:Uncharacterized protein n=1 Tax=Rotaria magnacalcarata TaxID=392030 RepID=A0A816V385_9BILA|nr:unnamed protein product [Rotaria magnacalcarata]
MSRILLYRSLIFTSTNLYIDRVIKRSASILDLALTNLIEYGLIHAVKKGLLSSKWTTVYVKILPDPYSTDDQMKFEFKLSELGISSLNLESLRDTCHELLIEGKGNVSEELIQFLQKPEYRELSLDMTTLIQRYNNCQPIDNEDVNFSHEPASATTIESTSVTHDSSCDTDTVWNAGNHLLAKMCEREEHADSNFNIVPDEMTTNAFQGHFELDSNTLFDDITTHISDGQQNTLENIDNYTDGNYFILCQLDSVSQTTSYRECSSLKISDNSPRTSISIVETLTWWYKYFLPHELTFMFYLHHRWSIYDPLRAVNIANEFRKKFGTMHSNEIINGVLAFFHSRPDVQLIPRNMFDYDSCYSNSVFMHLVPFTDICSLCNQQLTASHSHSRQVKVICAQGKVVFGTLFWLECRHLGEHKKAPPYFIFPNFIRTAREHIYTLISLYHSKYVYIGGDYAFSRAVVTTYSSNVVNHVSSWWKTADSLNLEAFNQDLEQVQPLCWKRLAQVLLVYHVLQFKLTMGCLNVKIPMSLNDFDDWIWNNYPKMLSWFIYLWSSHKQLIGPCHEKCSAAVIIDGHQKCRRRVCRYKDVEVKTDEFDKIVIGCCRSPMYRSHYCSLHRDQQLPAATSLSASNGYRTRFKGRKSPCKSGSKKGRNEGFGATSCRTSKAQSDAYIRRCSRSFGLIACVTNCRVFVSFGEIFRSETLREILHLLFSTIRVAGNLPPAACYDDGCQLVQYLHNHIGKDIVATDAATLLSNVKFSVDRTHFKNHVGEWCLANMNPDDNRLLDEVNTEAAEQNFSWLKNYSSIIAALGWRRAPVFLLLLFHMKNLALCHVRPNRVFDIVNNCVVVPDVSLPHSERITQVVETNSSLHSERESPRKIDESACDEKKINVGIPMMEPTNTDWAAQVSIIRKNNNIVDTRRHKKLKRL